MNHEQYVQIIDKMSKDEDFHIYDVDYLNGDQDTCIFKHNGISYRFKRIGKFIYLNKGKTCKECCHTNWNLIINEPHYIKSLEDIKTKISEMKNS